MKRTIIIILVSLSLILIFSDCRTTMDDIYIRDYYRLSIADSGFNGVSATDTIFLENRDIAAIGEYIIAFDTLQTDIKVNQWTYFYENGQIKMTGNYKVFSSYDCGFAGVYRYYYSIKSGIWTFFYPNGQLKAKGIFKLRLEDVPSMCRGHAKIYRSAFDNNWIFYDENGNEAEFDKVEKYTLTK